MMGEVRSGASEKPPSRLPVSRLANQLLPWEEVDIYLQERFGWNAAAFRSCRGGAFAPEDFQISALTQA